MQQYGIGPGHGPSNLATNHLTFQSGEIHPDNPTRVFYPFQQSGSESRTDVGRNAPHQQPPNQQTTEIHQQTGDSPHTPRLIYPPVARQSYTTVDGYDAANSVTPGSPFHGTAQSGRPTCQHVNIWACDCDRNEETIQTESDGHSYFEEAISPFLSRESSSESPQEQVSHHNNTASERPATPRPPEPSDLEIHGELNSHPLPWSSENPRGGEDPARAVMSQLPRMQRSDFDPIQPNAPDDVSPFTGLEQGQLPLVQGVDRNTPPTFSQDYQEPGVQGEGGQMGGHTENPNDPRTPRRSQPGQLVAGSTSVQYDSSNPAAQFAGGPSIPGTSMTTTSTQSFKCPDCGQLFTGRYWKGNWARHIRQSHKEPGTPRLECVFDGCGRSYARNDARLKHYRKHHPDQDYDLLGI